MSGSFASLFAAPALLWGLGLVLKVTVILAAGAIVAGLLRGASAAVRHFVWLLTLGGALALVVASPLVPAVAIPVGMLPAIASPERLPARAAAPVGAVAASPDLAGPTAGSDRIVRAARAATLSFASAAWRRAGDWLIGSWLLGALAVAAWCALGHAGLARLARRATPLDGVEWRSLLESVAARSGVSAPVRLLRARAARSPLTWGARRPIVLLPDDADTWPTERRRVVLAHELAHAARGDYLVQLVACAACALYWFHPLVWIAARRLHLESERACDDHVLVRGASGPEYATHLLDVARRYRALGAGGMLAIGMAQSSQLEGRLLAVLDESRSREVPRRRAFGWVALGLIVLPLATLRFSARPAAAAPRPEHYATDARSGSANLESAVGASPGERLVIDLETGGYVDVHGWDQPMVRVRSQLRGRDWRSSRVSLERTDRGARLHAWQADDLHSSSTSHHFEILVPKRFDVRISSAGGTLLLTDLDGEFTGNTGGGGFVINHVRGKASLSTGGGDIDVDDVDLSGSLDTGGGHVRLSRTRGDLKSWSGSGPTIEEDRGEKESGDLRHVTIDDAGIHVGKGADGSDARGKLHINQGGGDVVLDRAPDGAQILTGGGTIRVGEAGNDVSATTGGGDIEIGPVSGSVRASTGAGDVTVTIVGADGVERSVDIGSGTGSVVLELPPVCRRASISKRPTRTTSSVARGSRATGIWNNPRPGSGTAPTARRASTCARADRSAGAAGTSACGS
jgi:beta-lactamase regulating signal transducer with metallopeptidase domain